ncbi:hypothetical protein TFLX_05053 [Thermoflexales bacterium]|nr:hypothetical protein TFLX_05053 [Thermoflexales bacterium]
MLRLLKIFLVTIALTAIILDLVLLFEALQFLTSPGWGSTTGTVLESSGIQRARWMNYIDLTYTYRIGDQIYIQQRHTCFFDRFFGCPLEVMNAVVENYPEGSPIPIYYAPALPSLSVFHRPAGAEWLLLVTALPLALAGSLIVILPGGTIMRSTFQSRRMRSKASR